MTPHTIQAKASHSYLYAYECVCNLSIYLKFAAIINYFIIHVNKK